MLGTFSATGLFEKAIRVKSLFASFLLSIRGNDALLLKDSR